jgi:Fe-S-cluster containining protein
VPLRFGRSLAWHWLLFYTVTFLNHLFRFLYEMSEHKEHFTSHVCVECAAKQKNCCSLEVPLTVKDVERITALGFTLEDFAAATEYVPEDFDDQEEWWQRSFVKMDGKFFKLTTKIGKDEKCFFLRSGKGCVLNSSRPFVCRMFPFWVSKDGKVIYEAGEKYCHFEKKDASVQQGLALIQESESKILACFNEVKQDCIKNKAKHTELVKKLMALGKTC